MGLGLCVASTLAWTPGPACARDRGADGKFSERGSSHFRLHQDVAIDDYSGIRGSRHFELDVLDILEAAHAAVGKKLGLRPRAPTQVFVYDRTLSSQYFRGLFRFRAAGFYNGGIHVRGGTRIDERVVRTLHHEYVHAAIHAEATSRQVPAFIDEGVAEWFESAAIGKRGLSSGERTALARAAGERRLLPLSTLLLPGFADVPPESVGLAYLQSYAVVDLLVRLRGERSLRQFLKTLLTTESLPRALKRSYRLTLGELEERLRQELL